MSLKIGPRACDRFLSKKKLEIPTVSRAEVPANHACKNQCSHKKEIRHNTKTPTLFNKIRLEIVIKQLCTTRNNSRYIKRHYWGSFEKVENLCAHAESKYWTNKTCRNQCVHKKESRHDTKKNYPLPLTKSDICVDIK